LKVIKVFGLNLQTDEMITERFLVSG